ncbi:MULTISPECIES: radical SAM/SPASM domain-containing protein [unclassified Clostridioides]|uniref:radical SAM/SPASM domain-containing protein n=1 Tax=unclassified Clostridioides TaxID=2635829 RepID=UPI001D10258D|nr:radical SAM protein [Clostridioides sp. ES-S-0171-01]MCC0688039.1 radical SAM protein [Clostridioides sp. ES-S-0056-01]MCC0715254.1 radical SAM protein [Clostridioides sp. ES-S-0077-01]UDN54954.1 radical SAM protein [Clostridioides sp. ES-S-0054-01]
MIAKIEPGYGLERVKLSEVIPLDAPFTLIISPSTVCNFKCIYCAHSLSNGELEKKGFKASIMKWDTFIEIINQAKEFKRKFKVVSFIGTGEPTCNKRLPDMIKYVKESGIAERVEIITNGALLDEKLILSIINSGLDKIRISIQGLSEEMYKKTCNTRINFNDFVKNMKFLYDNKKDCEICIKIADLALDKYEEKNFYNIFGDICDKIFVENIRPVFDGVNYSMILRDTEDINAYGEKHDKITVCSQGFFTFVVWPNGDVYPCCSLENPSDLGNIHKNTLLEIWNGEKRRNFLLMQLNGNRFFNNVCKKCGAIDCVSKPEDELDKYAEKIKKRI